MEEIKLCKKFYLDKKYHEFKTEDEVKQFWLSTLLDKQENFAKKMKIAKNINQRTFIKQSYFDDNDICTLTAIYVAFNFVVKKEYIDELLKEKEDRIYPILMTNYINEFIKEQYELQDKPRVLIYRQDFNNLNPIKESIDNGYPCVLRCRNHTFTCIGYNNKKLRLVDNVNSDKTNLGTVFTLYYLLHLQTYKNWHPKLTNLILQDMPDFYNEDIISRFTTKNIKTFIEKYVKYIMQQDKKHDNVFSIHTPLFMKTMKTYDLINFNYRSYNKSDFEKPKNFSIPYNHNIEQDCKDLTDWLINANIEDNINDKF